MSSDGVIDAVVYLDGPRVVPYPLRVALSYAAAALFAILTLGSKKLRGNLNGAWHG